MRDSKYGPTPPEQSCGLGAAILAVLVSFILGVGLAVVAKWGAAADEARRAPARLENALISAAYWRDACGRADSVAAGYRRQLEDAGIAPTATGGAR